MSAWVPMTAALNRAVAQQTLNANGSLRLYTDALTPTGATAKAAYEAAQPTFNGYAPIAVAAWYAPILGGAGSYLLTMPAKQFICTPADPITPENVRGFYYLDNAGNLVYAGRFAADIPIAAANAGVPVQIVDVFSTGFAG